jgi:hypothetical protein
MKNSRGRPTLKNKLLNDDHTQTQTNKGTQTRHLQEQTWQEFGRIRILTAPQNAKRVQRTLRYTPQKQMLFSTETRLNYKLVDQLTLFASNRIKSQKEHSFPSSYKQAN